MANFSDNSSNGKQESSPLLSKQVLDEDLKEKPNGKKSKEATAVLSSSPVGSTGHVLGWTADGLPLVHRSVVEEPLRRSQWNSSLFACLGRNDEFCRSDIEVSNIRVVDPVREFGSPGMGNVAWMERVDGWKMKQEKNVAPISTSQAVSEKGTRDVDVSTDNQSSI